MLARLLVITLCLSCAAGCAAVKPYQRGRLAQPCMQLDPEPESSLLEQRVYFNREGSTGGFGGPGGGCGCN